MDSPAEQPPSRVAVLPTANATPELVLRHVLHEVDELEGVIVVPFREGRIRALRSNGVPNSVLALAAGELMSMALDEGRNDEEIE